MSIIEIIGYGFAILIGISLGLIGGGGSILTVPVLVYMLNVSPVLASGYSLFVVGITSLIGAFYNFRQGTINVNHAISFSIPSLVSVLLTRKFILPAIPEVLLKFENFIVTKDLFLMLTFSFLMLLVSILMIRGKNEDISSSETNTANIFMVFQGLLVGFISGFVGAGAGFLIIPALVIFSRLPMKTAIGTSLLIISINSLVGFGGDMFTDVKINWYLLLLFTAISIAGIFIGNRFSSRISGDKLKPAFGWFILVMGLYIITKEVINVTI